MESKNNRTGLFCIVTSFYWFSLYTYAPTLSTYSQSLGATNTMIGLIVGSYGLAQLILRVPTGIMSDILNRRKIFILLGIAVSLISSIFFIFFKNVGMVLVSRTLSGVAATTWVTFTVLFSSYYKGSDAPKAIGIINSYNSIGQLAAMLTGSFAAQYFGQQGAFIAASVGALIALVLGFGITENRQIDKKPLKPADLLAVSKDVNLILVSTLAIFSQFLNFATVFGFTPIVAKGMGASNFQIGMLAVVSTIPRIIASYMIGSFFLKYLGEKKSLVTGFILTAGACMVIPFISDIYVLYVSQMAGGFGQGVLLPMLMGLSIKNVAAEKRATAMGFFQAIYSLGMFLGPMLVGVFTDTLGITAGFLITGMVGVIGALTVGFSKLVKSA